MDKWFSTYLCHTKVNNTDKPDRFDFGVNTSGLSGTPQPLLDEKSLTHLRSNLLDDYEERLAIAEYDGNQSPLQAHRIAYQDALISVLSTLPHEENQGDEWLSKRIDVAKAWLAEQGIEEPN